MVLLTCLLITPLQSFAQQSASEKFDEAKVLELKKTFDITDEYDNFNFSIDEFNGEKHYSYHWSGTNKNLSVDTDEKGNLISYHQFTYNEPDIKTPILKDREEIEKIASDFLTKVDKNLLSTYKLENFRMDIKSANATLSYAKYVNDILVINDGFSVNVDLKTKTVESFYKQNTKYFKNENFPDPSKAISPEKAVESFKAENPYKLSYLVVDEENAYKGIPVYSILKGNSIDGTNGKFLDESIYNYFYEYEEGNVTDFKSYEKSITPVEAKEKAKIENLISEENVKKAIGTKFDLSDVTFDRISLSKYNDRDYIYQLNSSSKDYEQISIAVNAQTLEINSFNIWDRFPNKEKIELEEEEAIKICKDFLNKVNPDLTDIDIENPIVYSNNKLTTSITFNKLKNSIPILNWGISIQVDNKTKNVLSYYQRTFDKEISFEPVTKDIGVEKAIEEALTKAKLEKFYAYVEDEPKLIYTFKNKIPMIRATDGVAVNYDNTPIEEKNLIYKDIDKSIYKDEINYLTSNNIGIPNVENLKDKIKVKDFIYLLSSTVDSYSYYNVNLEFLENRYELLKQEDLEKNLQNKYAVRWTLNSLNFYNLNDFKDVFDAKTFSDSSAISSEDKAYFYIAKGLSIYDGESANPNNELTYEEALHLIYNLIK